MSTDADGGPRWIDAHCHLQDRYRGDGTDVASLAAEAVAAGVVGGVCIGTDAESSRAALSLAAGAAHVPSGFDLWATAGVHPHEAASGTAGLETILAEAEAAGQPLVGVGECGLDYHYDHAPRAAQRQVFAAQVALAAAHDLTLVVHTREAWDDTIDILASEGAPERTVLHCFTGGPGEARRCLDLGAYLSFSGIVTFRNADDLRAAAVLCPEDRLLVETDAPFLAPVPHRGQVNRPAWVSVVGQAVAEVRGQPVAAVAAATLAATCRAFRLAPSLGDS